MFLFGDPVEAAKLQLDMYLTAGGPRVPDIHFEDMEEQDLRNAMAYLYGALSGALQQAADDAMVKVLTEWYDEVFTALAEASEDFRSKVLAGFVMPPGGKLFRAKYLAIAEKASES